MSRVHDALRHAERIGANAPVPAHPEVEAQSPRGFLDIAAPPATFDSPAADAASLLEQVAEVPFLPGPQALLIDPKRPQDAPSEEFRSVRTRLNHLQNLQPIHSIVVTSPSPAEGKSFTAANLALAESHIAGNPTLLVDFDFRRPVMHQLFSIDRAPGATDFLSGQVPLQKALRRVAGTNLYLMPAGSSVRNPLEMLNLSAVKLMFQDLPRTFNWIVVDSPPLLFSADASLLGTICDGTVLVLRIGSTTVEMVNRALQSLCENNVLGTVVNGARAGELYSKYTYYYSKGYGHKHDRDESGAEPEVHEELPEAESRPE